MKLVNRMLVSVIMPTYNCGPYIAAAVESVLAQTISDWELIIVDDCSSDNTKEVLASYLKDPRIHYECLKENSGPACARTTALRKAGGRYIAFLDSDDLWRPDKLKKQIAFMEKHHIDMSCTAYRQMDAAGNDLHMVVIPPARTDYGKCIRLSNPLGNLTVMYNREKLGHFEVPDIRKRNDFALWLQILKKTKYCYGMKEELALYRMDRAGSVSFNKLGQAKYHWELYHKIEKHGVLRSLFELACWAFVKGTKIGLNRKKV